MGQCPGQDSRKLTISYHPCSNCQKPVEFFSDEVRVRCPHCKTIVVKEQMPSCVQWCQAARQCLGPELYEMIMGHLKDKPDEKNQVPDGKKALAKSETE